MNPAKQLTDLRSSFLEGAKGNGVGALFDGGVGGDHPAQMPSFEVSNFDLANDDTSTCMRGDTFSLYGSLNRSAVGGRLVWRGSAAATS